MKKVFIASLIAVASYNAQSQTQAGKTMIAKGKVAAELEQGSRKLKRRSPIYDNERVITGDKSKAQLRMTDGGMIALKENSELVIANYQYSGETGEGSVAIELLKGGLRSVTGAIKTESGDYNLKTPVGSIGIRGTHYEVEIVSGELFLAVWDGAVDLTLDTGTGTDTVSFGEGEDFSFGIVSEDGEVTQLLEPPANFDQGHSEDNSEDSEDEEGSDDDSSDDSSDDDNSDDSSDDSSDDGSSDDGDSDDSESSSDSESNSSDSDDSSDSSDSSSDQGDSDATGGVDAGLDAGGTDGAGTGDTTSDTDQDLSGDDNSFISGDEIDTISSNSLEDIVAERTGIFTYGTVTDSSLTSSSGGADNLQMQMQIDFDTGEVPTGSLSFNDTGGEWFAAFSGFLIGAEINLDITFASHGDNLADGDINAFFTEETNAVNGEFSLFELNNTNVTASGVYRIE